MRFLNIYQNSAAYDIGYNVGYLFGRIIPFIIIGILGFFLYKYFKNKSKK